MPDSPAPRRLTHTDLAPLLAAVEAVDATTDAASEREAVKRLWTLASELITHTPPDDDEAATQEALVDGAVAQLDAQMAVADAVAAALDDGGGQVRTAEREVVSDVVTYTVRIGRTMVVSVGPKGEELVNALVELATSIRDGDAS